MKDEFEGLYGESSSKKKMVAPEDEIFHSIYISGISRFNESSGVKEEPGKLQIRGVSSNHNDVNMIILHVKKVFVNEISMGTQRKLKCFSYKNSSPFKGSSEKVCPENSSERRNDSFCSTCREHIILSGIYTDQTGKPIIDKDNKPILVFIRANGMKYKNVGDYLDKLSEENFDLVLFPGEEEFEKRVVNNKKVVTKITVGKEDSNYGPKSVFLLEAINEVSKENVLTVLKIAKKFLPDFDEKFDWSKNNKQVSKDQMFSESAKTQEKSKEENTSTNSQKEKIANMFDFNLDI